MDDFVAQLVEHFPFKEGVLGSNPSKITKISTFLLCLLFFNCSSNNDKNGSVKLSGDYWNKKTNLDCARLIEKEGPEVDKAIDVYLKGKNSPRYL